MIATSSRNQRLAAFAAAAVSAALALGACANPTTSSNPPDATTADVLAGILVCAQTSDDAPVYWDGSAAAVSLTVPAGATYTYPAAIIRDGSSILAVGYYATTVDSTNYYLPCMWRNGTVSDLAKTKSNARALSVALNGTDVYIGGNEYESGSVSTPWYLKNGEVQSFSLPSGYTDGQINGLAAANGSVYAACSGYDSATETTTAFGAKDGVAFALSLPTDVTIDNSYARSVAVSGSSVRFIGYYSYIPSGKESRLMVPCVWDEAGNRTDLEIPSGMTNGYAYSAAFIGSDLYVGGYASAASSLSSTRVTVDGYTPYYWKNGAAVQLTLPSDFAGGRVKIAQNADGKPAFFGTATTTDGASYYCAWANDSLIKIAAQSLM